METLFMEVLKMSLIGGVAILAIIVLRLFMKGMPKRYSYALWCIPLVRLSIPISIETILSALVMNPEGLTKGMRLVDLPVVYTGIQRLDAAVQTTLPHIVATSPMNRMSLIIRMGMFLWSVGFIVFIARGIYAYGRVVRSVRQAEYIGENIYKSETVGTAFVLGIIRPRIYLPTVIEESEISYILCHEQMHIHRRDHITRCISYLVLAFHWFNPLVWIAFYLSGKDMEMACDEAVIDKLGKTVKKEYSRSLLNATTRDYALSVSPLAFGESDPKGRVKNILAYRQPKFYITVIGIFIIVIAGIMLSTNPLRNPSKAPMNEESSPEEVLMQYKTAYVGDNTRVSQLAGALPILREDLIQKYISIDTQSSNQLTVYYEPISTLTSDREDEIDKDVVLNENMERNALLSFMLIDNLEDIVFAVRATPSENFDSEDYMVYGQYDREDMEEKYGDLKMLNIEDVMNE